MFSGALRYPLARENEACDPGFVVVVFYHFLRTVPGKRAMDWVGTEICQKSALQDMFVSTSVQVASDS